MTNNKPTHEDELKAYPDEIGICAFKDGTYEVYPEHAEIPPAVKYIRADRASTPAPMGDEVIREAIEFYNDEEILNEVVEIFSDLDVRENQKKLLKTLITAATECQFNAERARALQEQVLSDYDVIDQLRLELAKSKEQYCYYQQFIDGHRLREKYLNWLAGGETSPPAIPSEPNCGGG